MKEKTSDKSVRNAHMLLAAYWVYKVLGGGNILKTTINVFAMDNHSANEEARRKKANEQKKRRTVVRAEDEPDKAAVKASAGQKKLRERARSKSANASAGRAMTGIIRNKAFKKSAKKLLKSARVI